MYPQRTDTCGALRGKDAGREARLLGWVDSVRDHGGLLFCDVRDRFGVTQAVFNPETAPEAFATAKTLRPEFVIAVSGQVVARGPGNLNAVLPTGEIEVRAERLDVLNTSETLPFPLNDEANVAEDVRLRYRYLDLRRPRQQRILETRHRILLAARQFLDAHGFLEIETPILTRSTPEGSREYLVPSRVNPGRFYSLPQSPQIYKQLLMVAGCDRYFQIAKCFRDEDLRADRQPLHPGPLPASVVPRGAGTLRQRQAGCPLFPRDQGRDRRRREQSLPGFLGQREQGRRGQGAAHPGGRNLVAAADRQHRGGGQGSGLEGSDLDQELGGGHPVLGPQAPDRGGLPGRPRGRRRRKQRPSPHRGGCLEARLHDSGRPAAVHRQGREARRRSP